MIGLGAAAGSLVSKDLRAARKPPESTVALDNATSMVVASRDNATASQDETSASQNSATASQDALPINTTRISKTVHIADAAPTTERAPAARPPARPAIEVIATRFPAHWKTSPAGDRIPVDQTLAYASEPTPGETIGAAAVAAAHAPRVQAPGSQAAQHSGYQLASIDPAPPAPKKRVAKHVAPKKPTLFNDAQIASIKRRLQLTPDQEQYWPPVADALRAIGWRAAHRSQGRRHGRATLASIDPDSPEVAQLKNAAFPLIMTLSEEQKREVRQLAHTMGLNQVASMI